MTWRQQVLVLTNDHMNQKLMMPKKDSVKKNKERKTNWTWQIYHHQACRPMNTVFLIFNFSSLSVTCDICLCYFYRSYSLLFIVIFAGYNINECLCIICVCRSNRSSCRTLHQLWCTTDEQRPLQPLHRYGAVHRVQAISTTTLLRP